MRYSPFIEEYVVEVYNFKKFIEKDVEPTLSDKQKLDIIKIYLTDNIYRERLRGYLSDIADEHEAVVGREKYLEANELFYVELIKFGDQSVNIHDVLIDAAIKCFPEGALSYFEKMLADIEWHTPLWVEQEQAAACEARNYELAGEKAYYDNGMMEA